MPRDAAGVYTLPQADVVDGTVIDSAWANPTMTDIADTITASLDRNGRGGMNVPILNNSGTKAAPGVSWTNEPQSGFYLAGLNDWRASINGNDVIQYIDDSATAAGSQKPVKVWNGTTFSDFLYGKADESPTFGALTIEGTNSGVAYTTVITDTLDITGNLSMENLDSLGGPFLLGSIGWLTGDSFVQTRDGFNISSVTETGVDTGVYNIVFTRNLLGGADAIVGVTANFTGYLTYPTWTYVDVDEILLDTGNATASYANWSVMAVLEDA